MLPIGSSLGGVRKPDFDDSIGVEVGGPLIKDKLFFWLGFAPRITDTHVLRTTYAQAEDPNNPGNPILNAAGQPAVTQTPWTARIPETHRTYYYAGTIDWMPLPDNHLTLALIGTPSFNTELKNQYGINPYNSDPRTAVEELTKSNTDLTAHWVSKLYERRWQIDVLAGMHYEYFYDRSPYADLNGLNQLQYVGGNLWDLEHATGCQPATADGFQPCPISPNYNTGGIGEIDKASAYRWSGEIKSTHLIEAGGHHELKYGWHIDLGTYDFTRSQSGPPGNHSFVQLFPGGGGFSSQTFFGLMPGESPVTVDPTTAGRRGLRRFAARLREEPGQLLLPAGQLQPEPPAQPDHQRGRAARAAKDVRQRWQRDLQHRRSGAAPERRLRPLERRPLQAVGLLRPLLRSGPARCRRALLLR